jgi:Ca2+-binding EF-hand superfamily protein
MKRLLVAVPFVALSMSSPGQAGNQSPNLIDALMRVPSPGISMTYEGVIARLSDPIRINDVDGNGLDSAEIDLISQVRTARERANQLLRFLAFDLNNDRQVSREEVDRVDRTSIGGGADPRQVLALFDATDINRDQILDWDEMGAPRNNGDTSYERTLQTIVSFDPTSATPFTLEDAKTLADQLFAKLDADRNGVLDRTELAAGRR